MRASSRIPTGVFVLCLVRRYVLTASCTSSLPITWRWSQHATLPGRVLHQNIVQTHRNSPVSLTMPLTVQEKSTNSAQNYKNTPVQSAPRLSPETRAHERECRPLFLCPPSSRPALSSSPSPSSAHSQSNVVATSPSFPLPSFPVSKSPSTSCLPTSRYPPVQRAWYASLHYYITPSLTVCSSPRGAPIPMVTPSA